MRVLFQFCQTLAVSMCALYSLAWLIQRDAVIALGNKLSLINYSLSPGSSDDIYLVKCTW